MYIYIQVRYVYLYQTSWSGAMPTSAALLNMLGLFKLSLSYFVNGATTLAEHGGKGFCLNKLVMYNSAQELMV